MNEDWAESVSARMEEMSIMDPELPLRLSASMANNELIKAITAWVRLVVIVTLAIAVPLVVIAWRAAF